jgi:bifunctional DNase/RNase
MAKKRKSLKRKIGAVADQAIANAQEEFRRRRSLVPPPPTPSTPKPPTPLSRRDYFIGQALAALPCTGYPAYVDSKVVAEKAIEIADHILRHSPS